MKARLLIVLFVVLSLRLLAEESLFGAFKVKTTPRGADITLYELDEYLCESPSPVYPVLMDEYYELREGIPGRGITLMITKKGYLPIQKEIFVPLLFTNYSEALQNPTVFNFELKRDRSNQYLNFCIYYSFGHHHKRHYNHHNFSHHAWHPHGWGGHNHFPGGGNPPPPPPPGGGTGGIVPRLGTSGNNTAVSHTKELPPSAERPTLKTKEVVQFQPVVVSKPPQTERPARLKADKEEKHSKTKEQLTNKTRDKIETPVTVKEKPKDISKAKPDLNKKDDADSANPTKEELKKNGKKRK